jgi:chromate transporter
MRDGDGNVLLALFAVFAPLSLLSFGGSNAVLADIAQQSVAVHGWVSEREFADFFALSRAAPGPGSMLVALIGWKVAGLSGALVATASLYLPGAILVYGASRVGAAGAARPGTARSSAAWRRSPPGCSCRAASRCCACRRRDRRSGRRRW